MKYLSESAGMGGIYAKMVADSILPDGIRLSTLELNYPRFIHAEFMTHRTHYDKHWQRWSGNFRGWIQYRQIV